MGVMYAMYEYDEALVLSHASSLDQPHTPMIHDTRLAQVCNE